ncbi:MAG: VCBS repeat-containing protein, partial [Bacteroidota bacterium]|nr:VCBS repeat-containing protein [Bacteroidota bacterium]
MPHPFEVEKVSTAPRAAQGDYPSDAREWGRIFALFSRDAGSTFYDILRTYSSGIVMRRHSSIKGTIRIARAFCLLSVIFVTCVQAQVDFRDHLSAEERQRWFPLRRMLVVEGRPDSADQLGSGFAMLPDANGDGWNDLAVSAQNRREMLIFYGGPGILDSIPDVVMPGGGTIATGDFNGDSLQDIAVQQPGSIIDLATGESIGSVPDSLFVYFAHRREGCIYGPEPDLRLGVSDAWGTSRDFGYHCSSGDFNGDGI